jgi:hypothetical protein
MRFTYFSFPREFWFGVTMDETGKLGFKSR